MNTDSSNIIGVVLYWSACSLTIGVDHGPDLINYRSPIRAAAPAPARSSACIYISPLDRDVSHPKCPTEAGGVQRGATVQHPGVHGRLRRMGPFPLEGPECYRS